MGGEFNQNDIIKERVGEDFGRSTFYVCGPPSMVASVRRSLASCGVYGSGIVMEGFSGY